ncbi:MAG: hypothetical protein ABJC33_03105 [Betaproteobacteria bacterium]
MSANGAAKVPKKASIPLSERHARAERRLAQQRLELTVAWRAIEARAYIAERRVLGFTRGFRAVLPLGALAGGAWLMHRYGRARLARPLLFGLSALNFIRRALPSRLGYRRNRNGQGNPARWLPLAVAIARIVGRRHRATHERRSHAA